MSFEETLVCDGCSRVLDGGSRESTMRTLRDQDGRAFDRSRRGNWQDRRADEPWASTRRHLCGRCAETIRAFYDGDPVPPRPSSYQPNPDLTQEP
jgi:hypothetical protein